MAVLTKTNEACILNHERAVAEAYKSCVVNSDLIEGQKSDFEQTDCEFHASFICGKSDHVCFKNVKPSNAAAHPFTQHLTIETSKTSVANIKLLNASYRFKQGFFCVKVPYLMDTQFKIVSRHFADVKNHEGIKLKDLQQVLSNKRKRKKKRTESNKLKTDEDQLLKIQTAMQQTGKELGFFHSHISGELDNNVLSRQLALLDYEADACARLLLREDGSPVPYASRAGDPLIINYQRINPSDLIHRRVINLCNHSTVIDACGTKYVLPAHSTFLLSNLDSFYSHLWRELEDVKYDLVVLDPPWENKSVKRKRSYSMMDENDLCYLPLGSLMCPGSLVALWITNNQRLEEFAHSTLFPAWSIKPVAKWFWLKVTQTGDVISSMDSGHKKPYEVLLLGRHHTEQKTDDGERFASLPEKFVMVSVPCSLHSKKPPLQEILTQYLPPKPRCLELFARNLNPGWTSWGREALKHQNIIFFEEVPCSE